jgi:uncharacterized protein
MIDRKIILTFAILIILANAFPQVTLATTKTAEIYEGSVSITYRNVTVYAPAVASTDTGYVGVISTITVTIQSNGTGRVFVDTLPLTQVDMQGSARLAVKVASALVENDINCDVDPKTYDYFFVVRTSSPVIGGPSAGAMMTVATIALLENFKLANNTVMTGMINPDGSIGPIGGITQKIDAAYSVGATHFLIPYGQGTYTELVTRTESSNGWIRTETIPVTRNVADYAMENYGITVTEVADINEALENFTGYTFVSNITNKQITTDDYLAAMEPLATTLLNDAESSYENATIKFENLSSSIPNNYPYYYRSEILKNCDYSKSVLDKSKNFYEENLFYTSISRSFQSLIYSRFVTYACDYFESDDSDFLENLLGDVQKWYESSSKEAKNAEIKGFISMQSVGIAQSRASEAKTYLDEAERIYEQSSAYTYFDVLGFLYNLAFVVERSNSIGWWINIGSNFNETGKIDNSTLENLALEYIEEASQAVVYSGILLQEMGTSVTAVSTRYLTEAEDLLVAARSNLDRTYPAAALFEALEAMVRANLALEIIGSTAADKIDLAKKNAVDKISKIRQLGIEPIIAVSYYEYAESLTNDTDFTNALINYKYSAMIAGALSFTNITTGTSSSRYVGIPETKTPMRNNWFFVNSLSLFVLVILGFIAGIGAGLIFSGIITKKEVDESQIKDNKKEGYPSNKIPKNPYFSQKEMPRSIKDYYKKNK